MHADASHLPRHCARTLCASRLCIVKHPILDQQLAARRPKEPPRALSPPPMEKGLA
ncbi:hypothetical protein CC78DRAFT_538421, partial [Lojkania enalia]